MVTTTDLFVFGIRKPPFLTVNYIFHFLLYLIFFDLFLNAMIDPIVKVTANNDIKRISPNIFITNISPFNSHYMKLKINVEMKIYLTY